MSSVFHGLEAFVTESNRIEGILGEPTRAELDAHRRLFAYGSLDVQHMMTFVFDVAGAKLREFAGMDVRVGGHLPPPGGPDIAPRLQAILEAAGRGVSPWLIHVAYETLHPFMDGNGRSGRALWAWQLLQVGRDPFDLGFLHRFYYQTLSESRRFLGPLALD